jgi:hypothetical protein
MGRGRLAPFHVRWRITRESSVRRHGVAMDVLIELSLRAVLLLLCHPLPRGLVFTLAALYGVGSGWPGWVCMLCGLLGVGVWLVPLWRWNAARTGRARAS